MCSFCQLFTDHRRGWKQFHLPTNYMATFLLVCLQTYCRILGMFEKNRPPNLKNDRVTAILSLKKNFKHSLNFRKADKNCESSANLQYFGNFFFLDGAFMWTPHLLLIPL